MPAAAVIPAPIAYINVVAVKKLVVGFWACLAGRIERCVVGCKKKERSSLLSLSFSSTGWACLFYLFSSPFLLFRERRGWRANLFFLKTLRALYRVR